MSFDIDNTSNDLEVQELLLLILKELKMMRIMIAEANRSTLSEDDIDV